MKHRDYYRAISKAQHQVRELFTRDNESIIIHRTILIKKGDVHFLNGLKKGMMVLNECYQSLNSVINVINNMIEESDKIHKNALEGEIKDGNIKMVEDRLSFAQRFYKLIKTSNEILYSAAKGHVDRLLDITTYDLFRELYELSTGEVALPPLTIVVCETYTI